MRSSAVAALALSLFVAPMAVGAEQASGTVHVVQAGETLSQIALDAGMSVTALAALNGIDDPNFLAIGQSLKLTGAAAAPAPAPSAPAPAAAAQRTYTVAEGDTLWAIAHQFGTSTDALAQLNNLDDPNRVAVGAVLTLPGAPAAAAPPPPPPTSPPAPTPPKPTAGKNVLVSYTVQPGETLNQIARQFAVRADAIVQANGLDDPNKLRVGVVIKVPLPGKEHVVVAGETLRDIAASEKVDLGSLIDFNQLDDPALIRVGHVVLVPVPAAQQVAAAAPSATRVPDAPAPKPTPKPAAPVAVVQPPKGAPTDGVVGAALKLLGAPYVFGGSSPSGFDCSGYVWYVAKQAGKQLTRGMFGEYNSGSHPAREELKPGDLVFFQNTYTPGLSHNGIYIGNAQFVHAADEVAGVTISSLNTAYWSSHWFGATRLP